MPRTAIPSLEQARRRAKTRSTPVLVFASRAETKAAAVPDLGAFTGHSIIAKIHRLYTLAPQRIPGFEAVIDIAIEREERDCADGSL